MTTPLDMPLADLAEAAAKAAAGADAEARAAGIEVAGLLKEERGAGSTKSTRRTKIARSPAGKFREGKGGSASTGAAARRKLGG